MRIGIEILPSKRVLAGLFMGSDTHMFSEGDSDYWDIIALWVYRALRHSND